MRKGFLINEEMRKYFPIYEEAVSHICNCSILNFLYLWEKIDFLFISVEITDGGEEEGATAPTSFSITQLAYVQILNEDIVEEQICSNII